MMKPTAVLVNTARGGIVDAVALVEALRTRRARGAGSRRVRRDAAAAGRIRCDRSTTSCSPRTPPPTRKRPSPRCGSARSPTRCGSCAERRRKTRCRDRRPLPHDAPDPPLRGARRRPRQCERDRRRHPRVRRPGGGRDRRVRGASADDVDHVDPPRPRPRDREGRRRPPDDGRAARPRRRAQPRARRLDARRRPRASGSRRERDRRGRRAVRRGGGVGRPAGRDGRRRGHVLRRRRRQPGRPARDDEPVLRSGGCRCSSSARTTGTR